MTAPTSFAMRILGFVGELPVIWATPGGRDALRFYCVFCAKPHTHHGIEEGKKDSHCEPGGYSPLLWGYILATTDHNLRIWSVRTWNDWNRAHTYSSRLTDKYDEGRMVLEEEGLCCEPNCTHRAVHRPFRGSFLQSVILILLIGSLEAAVVQTWVAQTQDNAILDIMADILIALVLSWPKVWRAPLFLMLEELTVYFWIYGTHWDWWYATFTKHWLAYVLPINPYPWVTGPIFVVVVELYARRRAKRQREHSIGRA